MPNTTTKDDKPWLLQKDPRDALHHVVGRLSTAATMINMPWKIFSKSRVSDTNLEESTLIFEIPEFSYDTI